MILPEEEALVSPIELISSVFNLLLFFHYQITAFTEHNIQMLAGDPNKKYIYAITDFNFKWAFFFPSLAKASRLSYLCLLCDSSLVTTKLLVSF